MFSKSESNNAAICLQDYGRIKRGAVVPKTNELYEDVEQWIAEGNSLKEFNGYPNLITKEQLIAQVKEQRKQKEAEGIIHNNVPYAGDKSNRQALAEAIEFATDSGFSAFPSWKVDDDNFITDHPVEDVKQAYRLIGKKRVALIQREGEFIQMVKNDYLTDTTSLNWEV